MSKINSLQKSKLFGPYGDVRHISCVNWDRDPWDGFAWGYKEGADALVEECKRHPAKLDTLVYPVVFLYRHYFELRLKILHRELCELNEKPWSLKDSNHKLRPRWDKVRALLEEAFPADDKTHLDKISNVILDFDQLDPDSCTFRYPEDKGGKALLSPAMESINVVHLKDELDPVINLLEGAAGAVAEALSHLRYTWG
jgi:hypothetical protein